MVLWSCTHPVTSTLLSCGGHIHSNTCALLMSTVPKTQAIHSHVLSYCLILITIISSYLALHLGHYVSLFLHLACSLAEEHSHQVPGTAAHKCRPACGCTQHHSVSLPGHWLQTLLSTCQHYRKAWGLSRHCREWFINETLGRDWRNSAVGKLLVSHMVNPSLISSSAYGPLALPGISREYCKIWE